MRPEDFFPPKTTNFRHTTWRFFFFLFYPINYYRSPAAATESLKREHLNKPLCVFWQPSLLMRTGGIHTSSKSRWTTARCFVPHGSSEHLAQDTYTAVGEICDRDIKLLLMNPIDRKHNWLRFVPEEKLKAIPHLLKKNCKKFTIWQYSFIELKDHSRPSFDGVPDHLCDKNLV